MYSKILGIVFFLVGLYVLMGAIVSFTNPNYPAQKALITGGVQLAIALFPLMIGIKLLRKKAAVINQKKSTDMPSKES
ncbi:hypothetical protein [Hydrogenimonas sp.]